MAASCSSTGTGAGRRRRRRRLRRPRPRRHAPWFVAGRGCTRAGNQCERDRGRGEEAFRGGGSHQRDGWARSAPRASATSNRKPARSLAPARGATALGTPGPARLIGKVDALARHRLEIPSSWLTKNYGDVSKAARLGRVKADRSTGLREARPHECGGNKMNAVPLRARQAAVATLASLVSLAVVGSPAAQAKPLPNPEYTQFATCPAQVKHLEYCLVAVTGSGSFTVGNATVPISNPIVLKGGLLRGSKLARAGDRRCDPVRQPAEGPRRPARHRRTRRRSHRDDGTRAGRRKRSRSTKRTCSAKRAPRCCCPSRSNSTTRCSAARARSARNPRR